jgi:hypothetical protein
MHGLTGHLPLVFLKLLNFERNIANERTFHPYA